MDAVEFIKNRARICRAHKDCIDCILSNFCGHTCDKQDVYQVAEQVVANVEQWAKEHPIKTRQSEFLKMFPNANLDDYGILLIAPCNAYDEERKKRLLGEWLR